LIFYFGCKFSIYKPYELKNCREVAENKKFRCGGAENADIAAGSRVGIPAQKGIDLRFRTN